jgi:hypothetical protein
MAKGEPMRVFISHAETDREVMRQLVSALAEAGHDVWYDEDEVFPGGNFAAQVGKAIESCQAMVVVLSAESARSPWVQHEIDFALTSAQYKNRLVTVLADKDTEIPWILKRYPVIEVRRGDFAEAGRRVAEQLREVAA